MPITSSLIAWYLQHKRALPWRLTQDPYRIWLSEVILQQTRVNQGINYYYRFLEAFPDVQCLAAADEQEVLKLWQGLGYYSRARNLHQTAIQVVEQHKGVFPQSAVGLKKLKGIGDYTAAAIASICFGEAVAVLDGNVMRVISRLFAVDLPVNSSSGRKKLQAFTESLLDKERPALFNQAVMELGALVCTPRNPACDTCPLTFACEALKCGNVTRFPVKNPSREVTTRYLNYLVINFKNKEGEYLLLRKRTGNDIWKNLYDFPCIETIQPVEFPEVLELAGKQEIFMSLPFTVSKVSREFTHQLTHRRLLTRFIEISLQNFPVIPENFIPVKNEEITSFPLPRLIELYLQQR